MWEKCCLVCISVGVGGFVAVGLSFLSFAVHERKTLAHIPKTKQKNRTTIYVYMYTQLHHPHVSAAIGHIIYSIFIVLYLRRSPFFRFLCLILFCLIRTVVIIPSLFLCFVRVFVCHCLFVPFIIPLYSCYNLLCYITL